MLYIIIFLYIIIIINYIILYDWRGFIFMGIIKKGITKAVTKGLGVKKQALTATGAKTVVKEGAKNAITGGTTKSVGNVTQYQAKAE